MDEDYLFMTSLYMNSLSKERTSRAVITDTLAAFRASECGYARAFRAVDARLSAGDSVGPAFASGIRQLGLKDAGLERRLAELSDREDAKAAIQGMYGELSHRKRLRLELGFGSLQKYLTVSLLASVILPSLALFGFVGYSMLYSSGEAFIAFSALLISAFPVSFALIQRRIGEIYA
jgi:hypothetical protein